MKLLYVACNPKMSEPLMLEDEINELTMRVSLTPGDRVQSIFLPSCRLEDLPYQIRHHCPDVLHIAAHGSQEGLQLAGMAGEPRQLTGGMLTSFLSAEKPPRILYLNACNSLPLGQELLSSVPMVVATDTQISNRVARASAGLFYTRLAEGCSVLEAFDAARAIGESLHGSQPWRLLHQEQIDPDAQRLCDRFEIVARFSEHSPKANADGFFDFDVGVIGCPSGTNQVVLFTDESTFIIDADDTEESDMAFELCMVGRHTPNHGVVWFNEQWPGDGDFRIYACAVSSSGELTTAKSTLCEALERCYRNTGYRRGAISEKKVAEAIRALQATDGTVAFAPAKRQKNFTKRKPAKAGVGAKTKGPRKAAAKLI